MRHAISVSIAVLLALLVSYYVDVSMRSWLVLTALLTSIAPTTVPIRERTVVFATVLGAVTLAGLCLSLLIHTALNSLMVPVFLSWLFIWLGMTITRARWNSTQVWLLSFLVIFMIALLVPDATLYSTMLGCIAGGLIGVGCSIIVLPSNFADEFSCGVLPTLQAMDRNLLGLEGMLTPTYFADLKAKTLKLQHVCVARQATYPEWVFNPGFNPGLRSGSRFFLIKLEQAQEILCALNYLIMRDLQLDIIRDEMDFLRKSLQGNRELFSMLISYFQTKSLPILQQDFTTDINMLENALQKIVPAKIELLEIAPEYIALTDLVREIKDLRTILLQLTAALPTSAAI